MSTTSTVNPAGSTADGSTTGNFRRLHLLLALSIFGVNAALMASGIVTGALKATEIDAANATTILSTAVAVGGVFTLIGFPLIGRISDRTTGPLGRRRPYLIAGGVLGILGTGALLIASSTLMLTVAYTLLCLSFVCTVVTAGAMVPDQIPAAQRGIASAIVGLGTPVGALVGLFVAQLFEPNLSLMILGPGLLGILGSFAIAFGVKDAPLAKEHRPDFVIRDLLATFWVNPLKAPSFAWAWVSRILIFLGVAAVNAYQAFYLIMVHHVDPAEVAGKVFLATLLLTGASMLIAPIATRVSDRIGRRKPFVIASAGVFALGLWLVASAATYNEFLVAVLVMGIGQGVYLAVDFALVTEVLPDAENPGKDLGIMNLANTLPTILVPAIAPTVLAIGVVAGGANFTLLFGIGAVAAVLGALAILPIRNVR
ncbi:MFS transporter [Demequina sp. NBRC 110051]|uniref:MFS transporter n=1 Tax=Demequina sp. NBRC 110051 TaxID=1570340 RepID=UPI000A037A06|nr:MFS transporter [Demequina sp. NBRC 110051]